jgi:serine/threonine protein kinase
VFEAMGPSTASMLRELQCNLPLRYGHTPRYPMWMAKRILKHALLRLSCLHDNGMAHGDVQPGNLLFTISDLTSLGEETLQQDAEQSQAASKQVKRLDGMPDRWAPRYLAESQSLSKYAELEPGLTVKGSDTGTGM